VGKDKLFLACRHARKRLEEGYRSLLIRREGSPTRPGRHGIDYRGVSRFRGFEVSSASPASKWKRKRFITREDQICFLSR
jgi:hypothetical protein